MSYEQSAASVYAGDSPFQDASPKLPRTRPSGHTTVYQTSGPDAYTEPIAASDGSGPALNPRSCVTCRRRKVRCDKEMPCFNCRKALIPCVYPAPGRAPRQPRPRDPNAPPKTANSHHEAELTQRLRKLESIVEQLSGQIEVESNGKGQASDGSPTPPGHPPARRSTAPGTNPAGQSSHNVSPDSDSLGEQGIEGPKKELTHRLGRMVLNDQTGNKRYVSNAFMAKLNDELDSLRKDTLRPSDIDSDASEDDETPDYSPQDRRGYLSGDHQSFIFGYKAADVDLLTCHPPPAHAPLLWATYRDSVEPLLRVLHVPTMSKLMDVARQTPERLSRGEEALVFAIYFSAVMALEPEEVLAGCNADKVALLHQYRFAVEVSLTRANFLVTSDLAVLQAFTIFLIVVRSIDDSRFCWTLTSLVIRIAHGMGLHRDGSQFDMAPFETEMRRRVWWALLLLDNRSAEAAGTELMVQDSSYDTKMPTAVDDIDISPEMTTLPVARDGYCDMAGVLARCEMLLITRPLLNGPNADLAHVDLAEKERVIVEAYERIEQRVAGRFVDKRNLIWWISSIVARIVVSKLCIAVYQPTIFAADTMGDATAEEAIRDRVFIAAIELVELGNTLQTDERCKPYRWLFRTYSAWYPIAFNLIELGRRPWSALAERSWDAVKIHHGALAKQREDSTIFLPLRQLFVRARRRREAELLRLGADLEAALRLDSVERTNPALTRFGPVPGHEDKMDEIRRQWWALVQSHAGASLDTDKDKSTVRHGSMPASGAPVHRNIVSMDLLDDIMAQPDPNIPSIYALQQDFIASNPPSYSGVAEPQEQQQQQQQQQQHLNLQTAESTLRQQAMALQARAASQGLGSSQYMFEEASWGTLGPYQMTLDQGGGTLGDFDMGGGGFDWSQWTNTLASYDGGGMPGSMG